MKLDDITVLVRDKALARQGIIVNNELNLEASIDHNNVGSWKLTLHAEHPMADVLRTPGSGIIVQSREDVLFSGPVEMPELAITADDPGGTITFSGVTDTVALADTLAYSDPAHEAGAQTKNSDRRTGKSETLMHAYVNANIGPGATAARRKAGLIMGADLARGSTVTKTPIFQPLGALLSELAIEDGLGLGFRIVQRADNLVFETYQVTDKTAEIRLDARNGNLASQKVSTSPPGLTVAIVGGQGNAESRQLGEYTTPASVAAQASWGRRIERFIDQRSESDPAALAAAGKEVLDDQGMSGISVQAVPVEDSFMEFGKDWFLGDRISMVVDDQELAADVTGFIFKVNSDGFKVGVVIGDPQAITPTAALAGRVSNVESRISAIERNSGVEIDRPYTERGVVNLQNTSTAAVPPNAWTLLRFTEDRDSSVGPDGINWIRHDTNVGQYLFHVDVPGRYAYNVRLAFPAVTSGAVGSRYLQLQSSTRGPIDYKVLPASATTFTTLQLNGSTRFAEGETFWVQVFSSAAFNQTIATGDQYQLLTLEYLGR